MTKNRKIFIENFFLEFFDLPIAANVFKYDIKTEKNQPGEFRGPHLPPTTHTRTLTHRK